MKFKRPQGWGLRLALGLCMATFAGIGRPRAATAPNLSIAIQGTELRLSWGPVDAGTVSTVQITPSLVSPDWQPLGGPSRWPRTGTEWTGPLPTTGSPSFFRIALQAAPARGTLQSKTRVRTISAAEMKALMAQYNLPAASPLGAEAWKLVYSTIDAKGQPTLASALAVLPTGAGKPLPLVAYQHGTIVEREAVPSRLVGEADVGVILGGGGYVAVLADYLGLGDSPGFHPYQHAKSQATAVVDALRAARQLMTEASVAWNSQLFLTGYSQGGHATLAAQREIELGHAGEFTITASAPCAGAYDMSGTTANDFLSSRPPPNPHYSAYLLKAYVEVYGLATDFASMLRPPYDTTLPPLFDGKHSSGAINAVMPALPIEILKPAELEAFRISPEHPLRLALADNDLHRDWVPKVPTRFYHCAGDRDVLQANSLVAFNAFKTAGAPAVEFFDPVPFADHGTCAPFSLFATKLWFDSLKR
jgi:dienelactone hydrolase